jgi:hypothetical protein
MQTNITRRRALRAAALATLAAVVAPAVPAFAAPAPADVPLIDRAEAPLLELAAILPRLDERDMCNVGHNLDVLYRASEGGPERFAAWLADDPLAIGEGNRICDELDRLDALEAEAEADRVIAATRVMENLGPIGPTVPMTETQARPLTTLDPPAQLQAEADRRIIAALDRGIPDSESGQALATTMRGLRDDLEARHGEAGTEAFRAATARAREVLMLAASRRAS